MASDKKAQGAGQPRLESDRELESGAGGIVPVDDIPDRLLVLANRLQKAIDSRRAVASNDRSLAHSAKGEDER
ncbi:hypothetical protein ACQKGL_18415 [Ensifer adhaerens]|uniref:hypothetical protein n=1 Tax=Ensifer adhaerens TaxID=106592 RepID=UPI003D0578B5